jgi:hypothetical protein
MGYDFYIACKSCKKFVSLARWRVFQDLQFPEGSNEVFPGAGNVAAVRIHGNRLRDLIQVKDRANERQKREQLATILSKFCDEHDGYELYFINDSGDFPWAVCDRYPWYEWAEIIGPNTDLMTIDLPKNLVHDLHLSSWNEIEAHLLKSNRYDPVAFPGEIQLVKNGFEKISGG